MQNYMKSSSELNKEDMMNIFLIRSGNIDVKGNFPHKYNDRKCVYKNCASDEEQIHIYHCKYLRNEWNYESHIVEYKCIFEDNINLQHIVMTRFMKNLQFRNKKISSNEEEPGDPDAEKSGIQGAFELIF